MHSYIQKLGGHFEFMEGAVAGERSEGALLLICKLRVDARVVCAIFLN